MYTDRLGKPLNPGDKCLFAVHAGRSSAQLIDITVIECVPLVPHRDHMGDPKRLMREDQANKASPTQFFFWGGPPAPDKAFVLKYEGTSYNGQPMKRSTDRVMDVVKLP